MIIHARTHRAAAILHHLDHWRRAADFPTSAPGVKPLKISKFSRRHVKWSRVLRRPSPLESLRSGHGVVADGGCVHPLSRFGRCSYPFLKPIRTRVLSIFGASSNEDCVHSWSLFGRGLCPALDSLWTRVVSIFGASSDGSGVLFWSLFGRGLYPFLDPVQKKVVSIFEASSDEGSVTGASLDGACVHLWSVQPLRICQTLQTIGQNRQNTPEIS